MHPKLIVLNGNQVGKCIDLSKGIKIGRSETCSLRIMVPEISREHCRIFKEEENFFIEDLNSLNGTKINNEDVKNKVELKNGDLVSIVFNDFKYIIDHEKSENKNLIIFQEKTTLEKFIH